MAIDVYLQIDGIKGESNDDKHKEWIECQSVQWGVLQPKSATASTGGGHTAERCEHEDIVLAKLADLSSPILLQACSSGKTIARAKFEFMRADGQGERVKYFEIELKNVLHRQRQPACGRGRHPAGNRGHQVFRGQVDLHPAEGQWRRRRQHLRWLESAD